MKKRLWSMLLVLAMLLTMLPADALAAEEDVSGPVGFEDGESETVWDVPELPEDYPSNEELFEQFLLAELFDLDLSAFSPVGEALSGMDKKVYDELSTKIKDVAVKGGSTKFTFTPEDLGIQTTWTAQELGIEKVWQLVDNRYSISQAAQDAARAKIDEVTLSKNVTSALLADFPLELYWYDKTVGSGFSRTGYAYESSMEIAEADKLIIKDLTYTFSFHVAKSYQGTGGDYTVTDSVQRIADVKTNAQAVVDANASKDDYNKLVAYRQWICDKVEYDSDAANDNKPTGKTPYGDPWQLINVFDNLTDNDKVVCEGYAKAFKYLCDLSGIECYTVSGTMSGGTGAGGHMWNIVGLGETTEGKTNYYLVDVTNCDGNSVGAPDKLFLRGGTTDTKGTYVFENVTFTYYNSESGEGRADQYAIYGEEILTLATSNYQYTPPEPPIATVVKIYDKDGAEAATATINYGDSAFFTAKVFDQYGKEMSGQTFTWTSSDNTLATASDGMVTVPDPAATAAGGTVTITASVGSGDTTKTAALTVTVPAKHVHTYDDTKWESDNDGHWHACTQAGCTEKKDYAAHTADAGTENKAPTCTAAGEKTFKCNACNQLMRTEIISALGHDLDEGKQTKAPTCAEPGEKTFTCQRADCNYTETEKIEALGHEYSQEWVKTDPDKHWHKCTRCDARDGEAAHTTKTEVTQAATCTEAGSQTISCTVCGWSKTEAIAATGHKFGSTWESDENSHWHLCETCQEPGTKAGHAWDNGVVTVQPSYTAAGSQTITCTACGQTKTEPVAQLTHTYSDEWSKDETTHWHACTDEGYTNLKKDEAAHSWTVDDANTNASKVVYKCECGATREEAAIDGDNHAYDANEWVNTDPNKHWHACTTEGHESERLAEADHVWTVQETTPATHAVAGKTVYECLCGATKDVEIPAHKLSAAWTYDTDNHWHACTEASCTEVSDNAPHDWDEGKETTPPTLTSAGVKTFTCTTCGAKKLETLAQLGHTYDTAWSADSKYHWHACTDEGYEDLIADKAAHAFGDWTITQAATATEAGSKERVCSVCSFKETGTIPATGEEPAPPAHTHAWNTSTWSRDASGHWHECGNAGCVITLNSLKNGYAAHVYDDDQDATCNVCGYERTVETPEKVFTVTFKAIGGTIPGGTDSGDGTVYIDVVTGTDGKIAALPTAVRSGYVFNGWFTAETGGTRVTTDTVFTENTSVYAQWTRNSTGGPTSGSTGGSTSSPAGGSTSGTTSTSNLPVTTETVTGGNEPTKETTAVPTVTVSGGSASATVSTAMGNEIVKQALANGSENVVIAPEVTGSVTSTEVSLPAATVSRIGKETGADLTVATPVANVTIPNRALSDLADGGQVTVTAAQTGDGLELSVKAGNRTVESVPGGLTVTVPVTAVTPGTVAVLVREDGTRTTIRKSLAADGALTVPLDGSAKIEIVDNGKKFTDVPATSWAADAVSFVSAHELFSGTSNEQFSPDVPMNRGMLAVVLHNLENNPAQTAVNAFADVDNDEWYAEGVAWAASKGIVSGYGNGTFGPMDNITREQLAVMLWRYAGMPSASSTSLCFNDAGRISNWAMDAMLWATENGIINGTGNGILDPAGQATRAQAAQMLMNFVSNMLR